MGVVINVLHLYQNFVDVRKAGLKKHTVSHLNVHGVFFALLPKNSFHLTNHFDKPIEEQPRQHKLCDPFDAEPYIVRV